jgi:hypothetical protein
VTALVTRLWLRGRGNLVKKTTFETIFGVRLRTQDMYKKLGSPSASTRSIDPREDGELYNAEVACSLKSLRKLKTVQMTCRRAKTNRRRRHDGG